MSKKKTQSTESGFGTVEMALSKTERFIEDNKKTLLIIVGVIIAVIGGILLYRKYVMEPKEKDSQDQMSHTEQFWNSEEPGDQKWNYTIQGDGEMPGTLEIIDAYKRTRTENLAQFMTGISYLHLGQYEKAIEHLEKFKSDDYIISTIALGSIGDAYVELGKYEDAVEYFEDAVDESPNNLTSPIYLKKAGITYLLGLNDKEGALECFRRIRSEFPNSLVARDINKYIEVVKNK